MDTLTLTIEPAISLTDEQLLHLCRLNKELRIERTKDGEILIMSPAGAESGSRNSEINRQLANWNKVKKSGIVFDSSSGFTLPDKAMRSPDAAWISQPRWEAITPEEKKRFAPLCPDFVIELMSESDALQRMQTKMNEWMKNGCRLAWLINPKDETVYVYRTAKPVQVIQGFDAKLSGEDVLTAFELDLSELR